MPSIDEPIKTDPKATAELKKIVTRWKEAHKREALEVEQRLVASDASEVEKILAKIVAHETVVSERLATAEAVLLAELLVMVENTKFKNAHLVGALLKDTFILRGHGARRIREYSEAISVLAARRHQRQPGPSLRMVG